MSYITKLLPDATNVGNLGSLPIRGRPDVNYVPKDGSGICYKNGKKGKLKIVNGRYVCQTSEDQESQDMETNLSEALKDVKEAKGLRFTSNSRMQIGKQYRAMVDHAVAVQGLGKLKASPIQGAPGNWFFTLTSNQENQFLEPSKMNGKIYAGVNVTTIANESKEKKSDEVKESPKSAIERMVQEALES